MAAVAPESPISIHPYRQEPRRLSTRAAARREMFRSQGRASPRDYSDFKRSYTRQADSSDDEDLAPIKLSAEAQAILGEEGSQSDANKENDPRLGKIRETRNELRRSFRRSINEEQRHTSPERGDGSPQARHLRLNGMRPTPPTVLERDGSFAYKKLERSFATSIGVDSKTPAPRLRTIRVSGSRSQTKSPGSSSASAKGSGGSARSDYVSSNEEEPGSAQYAADDGQQVPTTVARSRKTEENAGHSTMRVKRIGTGAFLNGPVRRGVIRRHSEEDQSVLEHEAAEAGSPEMQYGRRADVELSNDPDDHVYPAGSPQPRRKFGPSPVHAKDSLQRPASPGRPPPANAPVPTRHPKSISPSVAASKPVLEDHDELRAAVQDSSRKPIFKLNSLPPLSAADGQENMPPPTFRPHRPAAAEIQIHEDKENAPSVEKPAPKPQAAQSPPRQPLTAKSNNTPLRPAPPPPPKMSIIDAATSNAGNSRSKKSVQYALNGRMYRRLDCIGRGGSSRVFRVMAENYKIFALKRVNLEDADMAAIAGYKGEIELLKKLENVDRVIRLFDYEVNDEKGVLSMMMELGETDFNKMLNEQLKADNAKLDITFTRHYWKEMLECVQSVHDYDIVHSDLKPANFLLVKGQLKLIDFGIANAIQEDTVNVHRENQIGTPNYMSPESLVCHTPAAGAPAGKKLLKLGKPSDVWSLGCILYQMTYGQPPFAHITKQFERIMSIPNPKVEIQFPSVGIGGSVVPFGLIDTLRKCLTRDQTQRPTIPQLLSNEDPFLNPVAISEAMIKRMFQNVMNHCRKQETQAKNDGLYSNPDFSCIPTDEQMKAWPKAFYEKLRQAQLEGTAWM